MNQNKKGLTGKQRKQLLKTFGISVGVTLAVCIIAVAGVIITYNKMIYQKSESVFKDEVLSEEEEKKENDRAERGIINKTIAVFGVDKDETRTDVIFVVNFNSATNKIKVINFPRDTKVVWSERQRNKYNQLTGYDISVSKLNEMYSYGRAWENIGNIRDFTINEMENILTVPIDNYVVINIEAFNKIVEAIGGVEVDVPERMYYNDYSQGLHIDLQPGIQTLNAKQAEGFVRYRQYPRGDEDRVEVHQIFLEAFAKKVMSPAIFNNLSSVITSLFSYIKTDVALTEIFEYLDLLKSFSLDNLEFNTIPGYGDSYEGPSYFYVDDSQMDELIKQVFYDTTVVGSEDTDITEDMEEGTPVVDTNVSLEIYNAAGIKGLAGDLKNTLERKGYEVDRIDNYTKSDIEQSIIYAKDKEQAKQFVKYLGDAEIIEDTSISYDIQIVIGGDSIDFIKK